MPSVSAHHATALAKLHTWLAHAGNRANIFERAQAHLEQYAALPIRRFSNVHMEKAAGYVRCPATASMESVGLWLEAQAVYRFVAHGEDPLPDWRRAAAWRFWGLASQLARHAGGDLPDPRVHSDQAARALFLLAAIGDRTRAEQLGHAMLRLRGAGLLPDAGSKSGPFSLSLLSHWLAPAGAQPVRAFAQSWLVDTSGACDAYQRLIDLLQADADPALDAALAASAQAHQRDTRPSTDDETFDFDALHDAQIPMELLCYARVRHWLGHATPWPAQLPYQLPPGALAPQAALIYEDALLQRVLQRALAVQPGREILVREFGSPGMVSSDPPGNNP